MHSAHSTQNLEGMDVRDTDGEKIGKCGETLGDYFNVDAGLFGMNEYYVPFSAITEVADNNIFLNVRKDEIESLGWNRRPETTTTHTTVSSASGADLHMDEGQTMQLRQEELEARKQSVETGNVRVGKDVVEEQRTMDVPVTREEVYVELRPVDRRPADRPISESENDTIRVPVREERVEVEKQPVVYEEVGVEKRASQETRQVSDTVRREELRVENEGDADVSSA